MLLDMKRITDFQYFNYFRPEKIPDLVKNMLGNRLITKQTPKKGVPVYQIMVAESVDIFEEKYLCFLLDR